jgi:UDP-N-acetylmuramoyl-L-alanyl-D-glutamate--2,6-diaminopimelate ligase
VIVTDEDPYDENPEIIMAQIVVGAEKSGKVLNENLLVIKDRREAISKAFTLAEPGDMILVTGKGNEQGICVANGQILPWDDRLVVREELNKQRR